MRFHYLFVIFLVLASGCDSADAPDPVEDDRMGGIEVRTEWNTSLGILGESTDPLGAGEGPLHVLGYPNPAVGTARIRFDLVAPSSVDLWVERVEPTNAFHALVTAAVPDMPRGSSPSVKALQSGEPLSAGAFEVPWDGTDDSGTLLTRGYFRVWLRVGDVTRSWDMLRVADEAELVALVNNA